MAKVILFHWADYVVFALFLGASSTIGFYVAWRDRKNASSKDYLIGGRKMHWIPTSLSMQAAFLSAVSVLSTPLEIYYFGTMFSYVIIGCAIAFPVASHVFLAFYYKLNVISAYEYLEMRFNKTVRIVGALTFFLMVILYNSILLYTPAIALAQVTGLSINVSILLCGSICTIYTFSGGMKGTIWIDSMQVVIIFAGFFFLIIFGSMKVGGLSKVWEVNRNAGRIIFDDFRVDPTLRTTFWTQTVGVIFSTLCLWASSQTMIQKYISVSSLQDAYKTAYFNSITNSLFIVMATLVGLIAYAFYEGCDPLQSGKVTKFDQIVPLLVMEVTGHLHGLPGIFIATIFSASLSSLSGALTAMSAVTMYDFVLPIYSRVTSHQMTDRPKNIITKVLVLLYGVIAIGSGYIAQYMGDSILQITISIFGFAGGPLTSLIVMGICFPFVNAWGALSGLAVSLLVLSWMAIGSVVMKSPLPVLNLTADRCPSLETNVTSMMEQVRTLATKITPATSAATTAATRAAATTLAPWYYRISHFYYAFMALTIAIAVAIPVSLATGRAKGVDPKLTLNYRDCPKWCQPKGCRPEVVDDDNDDDDGGDDDDDDKNLDHAKIEQLVLKEKQ